MQEIFKELEEKLDEKALEHAINGQQFDEDRISLHAMDEYGKRDGLYEAVEIVKQMADRECVKGISSDEAVGFLSRYLDAEVYTQKCIEAHQMAIDAIRTLQILSEDAEFRKFCEERKQQPIPTFEQKCANLCTDAEQQELNNNIRKIGGEDDA
ncbi:MAG: hypothetical protein ACI4FX_10905 [Agathobacter sp.]